MPITRKIEAAYYDSNGFRHDSLQSAQIADVRAVLNGNGLDDSTLTCLSNDIVRKHSEAILGILTTGPRSRTSARKSRGTTNPRRARRNGVCDAVVLPGTEAA